MKKLLFILIFTAHCSLLTVHCFAGWQQTNGPYGGVYNTIALKGAYVFAGTAEGMFLSTNNGTSWDAVSNGLPNINISSIAISGGNIFAGTAGDDEASGEGIFLSTDNGYKLVCCEYWTYKY